MRPHEAAALAAIDAAFAEPVVYIGAGLSWPKGLDVTWSDVPADPFEGAGATARRVSCEIGQADLPTKPDRPDRIVRDGVEWKPIDVTRRDDIGKWVVVLERAG